MKLIIRWTSSRNRRLTMKKVTNKYLKGAHICIHKERINIIEKNKSRCFCLADLNTYWVKMFTFLL